MHAYISMLQIRVYPAMQFESQTLHFISPYYFEIRDKDEDKYKSIVTIFAVSILLPNATFLVFVYLAFIYSDRISNYAKKVLRESRKNSIGNSKHVFSHLLEDKVHFTDERDKRIMNFTDERDKRIMIFSISIASVILTVVLFAFHITASVELVKYGNEVLYNANKSVDSEGNYNDTSTDDQFFPILYVASSFIPTIVYIVLIAMFIVATCKRCFLLVDSDDDEDAYECLGAFLQHSIGAFLVYLGFYFLPYMILAFINDPIQTTFIYMIAASFILCVYLLTYSSFFYVILLFEDYVDKDNKCKEIMIRSSYATFALGSGLSIAYFLIILIFVITLGNFHNFHAVENLTLPIIIALITLFVFKPSYKLIKTSFERINIATTSNVAQQNHTLQSSNQNHDNSNQTADTGL